jgi:hypothetical protein
VRHLQEGGGSTRSRCDRRDILPVNRAPNPGARRATRGPAAGWRLFAILFRVFENLRFVGSYTSSDGAKSCISCGVWGDTEGEGVDMMRFDGEGLIEDYRVMVRPLSAVVALRDAAFSQLPDASEPA